MIELGLHDYSVRRTVSRLEGGMVFNAGEWQVKLVMASSFAATIPRSWFAKAME